jgi:DNA-binding CsgD family transcriptional regulator
MAALIWEPLARAIAAAGTDAHVDRLIDLIGAGIPHEMVTVTRYSATRAPEFVRHRRFSDEMVRSYLQNYYVYDPFYALWRRERRPGIVALKRLADDEMKRGRYIAEFLARSSIRDELGVMLGDGGDCCLGVFLDRTRRSFRDAEVATLEERFPVLAALHEVDVKARGPGFIRPPGAAAPAAAPQRVPTLPPGLWPELSARERQLVQLILAGHPNAGIASRLGISLGTVKNHRGRIYDKLDITSERELFLEFFQHYAR